MHIETRTRLEAWNFRGVLCLSGPHGIGKTWTVRAFCAQYKKTLIDIFAERERHDVKYDRVPLPITPTSVGLLDAPFPTAGDGGIASLKRFLLTTKIPVIVIIDPMSLTTYADICKTFTVRQSQKSHA